MRIGFASFDHLRDWTGITRLIDHIACELQSRGHSIVLIAQEGSPSQKVPVSPRSYPHELVTINLGSLPQRLEAKKKVADSGIEVCAASVGDRHLLYMPWLLSGSGIPFVIGEPADPRVFTFERWHPYENYGALVCADAIQVLLAQYLPLYPESLRLRCTVIGNPAPPPAAADLGKRREKTTRTLLGVGRFEDSSKRFSLLLAAFASLCEDFPDWRLKLVGDGPHWDYYHLMAEQLGIAAKVEFTGSVADPGIHYADADVFCLSSVRAEGLPMVLLEASSHALPLVGFKSCVAAEALITAERGALAEGPEEDAPDGLADALRSVMALSEEEREEKGIQSLEWFQEAYGGNKVFDAWERLLAEVCEKAQARGETALGRIERSGMGMQQVPSEEVWEGLGPDSALWTQELLEGAAREIVAREDPLVAPETSEAAEEVESARLRSELAQLKRSHKELEKKYATLLGQYQTLAGQTQNKRAAQGKQGKQGKGKRSR